MLWIDWTPGLRKGGVLACDSEKFEMYKRILIDDSRDTTIETRTCAATLFPGCRLEPSPQKRRSRIRLTQL